MKKKLIHATLGIFLLAGAATPGFAQWEKTNWTATGSYLDLYVNQDNVVARTWDVASGGRTFLSTDNGMNWTSIAADSSKDISSVVILNNDILAGTWEGFIRTTVGSTDWTDLAPAGIPADSAICSIALINADLFAGGVGTIYKSSDSGDTWTENKSGIPADTRITSFVVNGSIIFAGSDNSGVYVSTNAGSSWIALNSGLTDLHISQLVIKGDYLYAVTLNGTFVVGLAETEWAGVGLQNINCLAVADNKLYAGTDVNGMYMLTDDGTSWYPVVGTGMPDNTRIWSMAADASNLIAGTSDGVWRVPLTSIVLPVENGDNVPEMFVLERNYPNPFNPSTTIGFTIPAPEQVTLTIYNVSGQKIRALIDAPMTGGTHKVVWDGLTDAGIRPPSGVYLYELRAGAFRDAKKLLLMK